MPKVTIGMPIYKYVTAETFASILNLRIPPGTEFALEVGSLVYDARNRIAMKAFENGSDYILWLDSDMTFPSDTLVKLLEDMENKLSRIVEILRRLYDEMHLPAVLDRGAQAWMDREAS